MELGSVTWRFSGQICHFGRCLPYLYAEFTITQPFELLHRISVLRMDITQWFCSASFRA